MLPHYDPQPTLFFTLLPPSPLGSPAPGAGSGVVDVSYQKLVVVSFKIDVDLLRELDEYAKSRGMDRSEVIRRAIAWYIKSYLRPAVTPRMTIHDANHSTSRIRFR
jgi:hypothetical protein